jgi:ubiquinone/menaquinone biosynthesis C-methylase UbiE
LFDFGAEIYAWFNSQKTWHESNARLAAYFPPPPSGRRLRVLDLGCGPGFTAMANAEERPDAQIMGVDLAPRMLKIAQRRSQRSGLNIAYIRADATALPFANDSIDVTTGHSFLYLVPNRAGVLSEAYRVLRSGGCYVSMEPRDGVTQPGILRRHWHDVRFLVSVLLWRPYSKYHGRFDEKSFPATLEHAGFKNTSTEVVLEGLGIIGCGEK